MRLSAEPVDELEVVSELLSAELSGICERTQQELVRLDQDVAERYFAGAAPGGAWR